MTTDVSTTESDNTADAEQANKPSIWIRGLYMLLFLIITRLTEVVVGLIMVIQFIFKAATGTVNDNLLKFGDSLSQYLYEIVQFQTFNTEDKPFPFAQWPESSAPDTQD